jgi:uncharacterized RDD family membrane protein YckC
MEKGIFNADILILKTLFMEVIDQPLIQTGESTIKYGGFWPRLGALLIDGVVLAPVSIGVSYFNITSWKSSLLLVVLTLVSVAYKPFMEFNYGATLGKMALKLKVVSLHYEKASLGEILARNIFHIVPTLLTLFFTINIYNDPEFESITGFMEYSTFTRQFTALQFISIASGLITIVDGIVLLADKHKRSLHDKIGQTCVIDQS